MLQYKVVHGKTGLRDLEKEVTDLINKGWKPIGGIAFNAGYCYQAMAGKVEKNHDIQIDNESEQIPEKKNLGAIDAMKRIDDLT